jgi:hypothetical protein
MKSGASSASGGQKRTFKVEYIHKKIYWGGMQSTPRPFVKVVEASQMDYGSKAWNVVKSSWQAMAAL